VLSERQERVFKEATAQFKLWRLTVNSVYVFHSDVYISNSNKYVVFLNISTNRRHVRFSNYHTANEGFINFTLTQYYLGDPMKAD